MPRPWPEVAEFLSQVRWTGDEGSYLFEIIEDVLRSNADEVLAVTTSMHDLIVVPRPIDEPPYDVVAVRAPGSIRPAPTGSVRIQHLAVDGHDTDIVRPVSHALPLFWRFIEIEFGIRRRPGA